jgi:Cu+-exporting ATPase
LAAAIRAAAHERGLPVAEPRDFRSFTGKGVSGTVNGQTVTLGNIRLMHDLGAAVDGVEPEARKQQNEGATTLYLAVDARLAGVIAIADPVKHSTPDALRALSAAGLRIMMLTGDTRSTAEAVGRRLGIADVQAEVLPADKQAVVTRLRSEGRVVAMAGDGVNDAPALAAADIGIAMGTGTEVAIASAGITLVKGDLTGIVRAVTLSRATMRNIRQNLFFAFVYNAIGVPLAAGVLYPLFGLLLSPMIAALAMSLSSVSVIGNALRLRRLRLQAAAP